MDTAVLSQIAYSWKNDLLCFMRGAEQRLPVLGWDLQVKKTDSARSSLVGDSLLLLRIILIDLSTNGNLLMA